MEKQVERIYEKLKNMRKESVLTGIAAFLLLMGTVSILYGSPFPYTEPKILGRAVRSGWILEKNGLLLFCGALAVVDGVCLPAFTLFREIRRLDARIREEQDAEKFLRTMEDAVARGKALPRSGYRNAVLLLMQQRYLAALLANGKSAEAGAYLDAGWEGKKDTKLYRRCRDAVQKEAEKDEKI